MLSGSAARKDSNRFLILPFRDLDIGPRRDNRSRRRRAPAQYICAAAYLEKDAMQASKVIRPTISCHAASGKRLRH